MKVGIVEHAPGTTICDAWAWSWTWSWTMALPAVFDYLPEAGGVGLGVDALEAPWEATD